MVRISKVNVQFDMQILNDEGVVVDSKVGSLVIHEAGFDVTLQHLSSVLAQEFENQQNQGEKEANEDG